MIQSIADSSALYFFLVEYPVSLRNISDYGSKMTLPGPFIDCKKIFQYFQEKYTMFIAFCGITIEQQYFIS